MKKMSCPILGVLCFLAASGLATSLAADKAGNGGDECERRILEIRDDIAHWIQNGGSSGLSFPNRVTLGEYNEKMLFEIGKATVSCQDAPVKIGSAEKTCINFTDSLDRHQILCNRNGFMRETPEDQQFILIHHEYAGLAGFEANEGDSSTYLISNQLAAYLEMVEVRKLALKPVSQANEMNFVRIEPGTFIMGSPVSERGPLPQRDIYRDEVQHPVTISRPFEMQITVVTQAQWVKIMGTNPSSVKYLEECPKTYVYQTGIGMCSSHPAEASWEEVQEFLRRLNQNRQDGYLYRLPTEAEWEYAARAGSTGPYYFGDNADLLAEYAWFHDNSEGHVHEVAQLKPNPWGLYDMVGNIQQWVQDYIGAFPITPVTDPVGPPTGEYRVIRGGWYHSDPLNLRSANRFSGWLESDHRHGFRVVRSRLR